jgi:hypothetical protein
LDLRLHRWIGAGRKIGEDETRNPQRVRLGEKSLDPIAQDGIEIAEHYDRPAQLRPGDEVERATERHSLPERLEGGALDGWSVGERITEGHADLDDISHFGSRSKRCAARVCSGVARSEVGNESRPPLRPKGGPGLPEP